MTVLFGVVIIENPIEWRLDGSARDMKKHLMRHAGARNVARAREGPINTRSAHGLSCQ